MNLDKSKILSWSSTVAGAGLDEYVKNEEERSISLEIIRENM